jgi:hypothetical protein
MSDRRSVPTPGKCLRIERNRKRFDYVGFTGKKAGFRSLADTWADTTTPHGRLMLTVLGGLAESEKELDPRSHHRRTRAPKREASNSAASRN